MPQKKSKEDDGLSLTGSQIGIFSASGNRPNSAKWSGRNQSDTVAPQVDNYRRVASKAKKSSSHSGLAVSQRSATSSGGRSATNRSASNSKAQQTQISGGRGSAGINKSSGRDDFLALFESSMKQSQTVTEKSQPPHRKPAWATPIAGTRNETGAIHHSLSTAHQPTSPSYSTSQAASHLSHSIFQPTSARSSSTVESVRPATGATDQRPSIHGDNELSSRLPDSEAKSTKMNSIANNMTAPVRRGERPSVLRLETSYQNVTRKTPVNQVSGGVDRRQRAAMTVQRWWRRRRRRMFTQEPATRAGEAAVMRMLAAKRKERDVATEADVTTMSGSGRTEEERKAAREEKARQARLRAIEELQQKREEKRRENQQQQQKASRQRTDSGSGLSYLQASGALAKSPATSAAAKSNVQKKAVKKVQSKSRDEKQPDDLASGADTRRSVNSSVVMTDKKRPSLQVDDFFQEGSETKAEHLVASNNLDRLSPKAEAADAVSAANGSQASTNAKTTLDDLMMTLQKLEKEDVLMSARQADMNRSLHRVDAADKASEHVAGSEPGSEPTAAAQQGKDNLKQSGLLSDEKLRSILSYLDEVESADRISDIDQELLRANQALETPAPLVPSGEELEQMERASASAAEVTRSALVQRLELDEKKRTVTMLQKALSQQRELTVRHAKETERDMQQRLHVQKDEYEETVKRHLGFIDQLIDDKKVLTERCEKLVKELKDADHKAREKFNTMQQNHEMEMRKLKELNAAAEKLRREKWIDDKTKKIKEMTVRGLEPEIQRLIAAHKAELKKMRSIHEAELLASDERAGQRYVEMTEQLRDQLAREKEAACARERELARQTYEKQMEQEESAYQAQRRRLYAEVGEEKERLAAQAARQRTDADRLQRQLEDGQRIAAAAMREEYERAREEQERRHVTELHQCEERVAAEKAAWDESEAKRRDTWQLARERELREEVRAARDRDIELVIERLERDAATAREEADRLAENRIKRVRSKYEGEMAELERAERLLTEKYNQNKAKLTEVEGENERQKVVVRQKDKEITELNKLLDRLNSERERVSDVVRAEFAERLVTTEEESRRLKTEMSEMKARHRVELERAREDVEAAHRGKDDEMAAVHDRVKQAIVKKEEVLNQLRQQHQAALKRADHLEGLLEQQRKQLLKK